MESGPEKRPRFVRNFLSRARGVFHKERNITSMVEDVWETVNDISDQIFHECYLRYNSQIPNRSLDLLLNVALQEAVFYKHYQSKPLPTAVFSEFKNRFGDYKSKIYDSILQSLGTTDVKVTASLIAFYGLAVLPKAEDIVTNYKERKPGAGDVRSQMEKSVSELLSGMEDLEASVRKK